MSKIEKEAGLANGLKWLARVAAGVSAYDPGAKTVLEVGEYGVEITATRIVDGQPRTGRLHLEYSAIEKFKDARNEAAFAITAAVDNGNKEVSSK